MLRTSSQDDPLYLQLVDRSLNSAMMVWQGLYEGFSSQASNTVKREIFFFFWVWGGGGGGGYFNGFCGLKPMHYVFPLMLETCPLIKAHAI